MAYILVVDDDSDFADVVTQILRKGGHEVSVELDTESAVTSMENRRPDLLILDVMFPENPSAGFALARAMSHRNEKLRGIPILILTAINARFPLGFGPRDIDDTWLPISDLLEKPVDFDILLNRVDTVLRRSGPRGARRQSEGSKPE